MPKPKPNPNQLVITEEFIEMIAKILDYFKGDIKKTRAWIITPNPQLGAMAPLKLIMIGKGSKVIQFINDAAEDGGWKPREWEIAKDDDEYGAERVVSGPRLLAKEKIKVREIKY